MDAVEIKHFVEAALLAAGRPLGVDQLQGLFDGRSAPDKAEIRAAIATLNEEYAERGILIAEVASGFRVQIRQGMADRLQKLWEGRPPRYSRALFETLALVAYRQPITRGEIEEIRGVTVSPNIVRTLQERDWVRVVGHRDVPGRPEMFGTTKAFLDYFGLKKLDDLPALADLADWESLRLQLDLPEVEAVAGEPPAAPADLPDLNEESRNRPVGDAGDGDRAGVPQERGVAAVPAANALPGIAEAARPGPHAGGPAEELEELVVKEWPDPAKHAGYGMLDDDDQEEPGPDASATGA
jgi:segregation and condensation protein B